MALARVVSFEGVGQDRVEEIKQRIDEGPPDDLPAKEIVMLYDAAAEKSVVMVFFDSEEDYEVGDRILSAMPADDTPGRRASVDRYEVVVRATA